MKRMLALAMALLLLSAAMAEGNWYVDEGQALAQRMQTLAADDVYMGMMMANSDEETTALKDGFAQADLSRPTGAWFLPMPEKEDMLTALLQLAAASGEDLDLSAFNALSDVGREELIKRIPASATNLLISREGVSWIVLSSLLSMGKAVEEPEDFAPGYLLLEYPGDYSILLTFTHSVPGYASVGATLAPAGCLETIKPVLEYARMLGLSVALEEVEFD